MAAVAETGMIVDSGGGDDQFQHHRSSSLPPPSCDPKSEFQRDVRELVDLLSKLNPSAKEFFPSSYSPDRQVGLMNGSVNGSNDGSLSYRRKKHNHNQGRRRLGGRAPRAQRDDSIRRTVYVSEIDQHKYSADESSFLWAIRSLRSNWRCYFLTVDNNVGSYRHLSIEVRSLRKRSLLFIQENSLSILASDHPGLKQSIYFITGGDEMCCGIFSMADDSIEYLPYNLESPYSDAIWIKLSWLGYTTINFLTIG
ncbi:hypothetical protein GIB67_002701 [Kingdonia uniflora]|uniref:DUF295 domain-containing protein n=1 Tax=Kingdonia uniflora TaxID=39325 RepID=A0A7J7LJM3_9MAGN|nr:hypothetical protein GIB67_002701 [Kingdonia uniflora]